MKRAARVLLITKTDIPNYHLLSLEISSVDKANPLTIGIPRGRGKIVLPMIQSNEINNVSLKMAKFAFL
jgi:hypothetical protein